MTPAEREAANRAKVLAAFEAICPHVIGNPYIPHWPTPPQQLFLGLHLKQRSRDRVFEALYGGAAGGGKSDCLLMAAAQYAHDPQYAAIIFRRTFADLALPGAIMDRALAWWRPLGVAWSGDTKTMRFPSGAKISFAYLQHDSDHLRYQGAEFQLTAWDELTQFPLESQYSYVGLSRVRRKAGSNLPLRTLSASNPGGPGHVWVKDRFVGDPANSIRAEHSYVPARLHDNPHIDKAAYERGLQDLHPTVRAQLLNGDWSAREPGDYFRAEWFGPLLDPEVDRWLDADAVRIRWWDLAASEKADAARTAGVLMARRSSGVRAIEHCRAFRATPGKRDDLICQQAAIDGHGVIVGLEIEGGSGGPAQFEALSKRLRAQGFRVVGARPRAGGPKLTEEEQVRVVRNTAQGKVGRADPVASCLERGYQRRGECPDTGGAWWGADLGKMAADHRDGIRLFAGPWTRDYLDEVEGFPDAALCDCVDATSGAWAWLEAHPFGRSVPSTLMHRPKARAEAANVHPADRHEANGKPRRWEPS